MVQSWLNSDSLYLKFGTDKATANIGGEYRNYGDEREVEFTITLSGLTETETPLSDQVFLPAGARISAIEVLTTTAAATGAAIDLGLIKTDRTTEIDYNGLLDAYTTAKMDAAGERNVYQSSGDVAGAAAGALLGTNLAFTGYVTCSRTTATAFTAGVIRVKIRFYMP
jgi:hypothetical protein